MAYANQRRKTQNLTKYLESRFSSLTLSSCKEQISGKFSRSTNSNNESVREIQVRTADFQQVTTHNYPKLALQHPITMTVFVRKTKAAAVRSILLLFIGGEEKD